MRGLTIEAGGAGRATALFSIWLVMLATSACGGEPPPTGVDLRTPVPELSGWSALVERLDLPEGRDAALARWVEVFREGLDIARRTREPDERTRAEDDWWRQAGSSLEAVVGVANVEVVLAWLEGLYGRRGGVT